MDAVVISCIMMQSAPPPLLPQPIIVTQLDASYIFHVNPTFHPTCVAQNLGLTWEHSIPSFPTLQITKLPR